VLAHLSYYTHRVAISNSRLVAMDDQGVRFRWKDYRAQGRTRHKTMTLLPQEFMRRFLLHVLPGAAGRGSACGGRGPGHNHAGWLTGNMTLQVRIVAASIEPEAGGEDEDQVVARLLPPAEYPSEPARQAALDETEKSAWASIRNPGPAHLV
jgi:Putative transposase